VVVALPLFQHQEELHQQQEAQRHLLTPSFSDRARHHHLGLTKALSSRLHRKARLALCSTRTDHAERWLL
jgi:hypothetical protein